VALADVVSGRQPVTPIPYLLDGRQGSAKKGRAAVPGRPLGRFVGSRDGRAEDLPNSRLILDRPRPAQAKEALSRAVSSRLRATCGRTSVQPHCVRPCEGHALPTLQGLPSLPIHSLAIALLPAAAASALDKRFT
jgi:hypothetical protein